MTKPEDVDRAPVHAVVMPPFAVGKNVVCIRDSKERDWLGNQFTGAMCIKDREYTINGCVWSYAFGWLVSITRELHSASDFRSA
jgi:hypothetical protein